MKVIGITGYAQHGKDTLAAELVKGYGFTRMAFADPLKSMALALNPYILGGYSDQERLVITDPDESYSRLEDLVRGVGWDAAKTVPEVRRFLQVLGTEAVRDHLGENAWVNALYRKASDAGIDKLVIPDMRFPNECESVSLRLGLTVRISRVNPDGTPFNNGIGRDHPSESQIASLPVEFEYVVQTGDLISMREIARYLDREFS